MHALDTAAIYTRAQPLIDETYTYAPDGTISVTIANLSRGYERSFSLGALR